MKLKCYMDSADGSNQISKFPKFHKTVHVISQRFKASGRQFQLTFLATLTRVRHWPGINCQGSGLPMSAHKM